MTPTLSQLLSARPKAVVFIQTWDDDTLLSGYDDEDAVDTIRNCCHAEGIGRRLLDSIETLLDLIEAKCVAEAPLSDAEIEGMKWKAMCTECIDTGDGLASQCLGETTRDLLITAQHACISTLHREIRRLRKGADHA